MSVHPHALTPNALTLRYLYTTAAHEVFDCKPCYSLPGRFPNDEYFGHAASFDPVHDHGTHAGGTAVGARVGIAPMAELGASRVVQ